MKIITFITLLLNSLYLFAGPTYYGAVSTEAVLDFDATIEIPTARTMTVEQLNSQSGRGREVQEIIDFQISHLIGHFQSVSYTKSGGLPGVLGDTYKFQVIKVSPRQNGVQLVHYRFKGKVNVHSGLFRSSKTAYVPLRLPLNPYTNYSYGVRGGTNLCTDEHYNTEGDYFYFWDPDKYRCPLRGNHPQVVRVNGRLTKLENTRSTYPEYHRLYQKDYLVVSVFIGYIDEVIRGRIRTSDQGYQTYKQLMEIFKQQGFRLLQEKKRFKRDGRGESSGNAYIGMLSKTITNNLGRKQEVVIKLLLADSELDSRDRTFEIYYADALLNSDIIAYDGHSGLGGNLDLSTIPGYRFKNNYQIMFLNGCSSYPYFNSMYFNAKPAGRRNLEIVTTGLPTMSNTSLTNMMAFLSPFLGGKTWSYQTLLQYLERSNQREGTYLMGVNGDEDNVFRP